jgi:hypothetical protein
MRTFDVTLATTKAMRWQMFVSSDPVQCTRTGVTTSWARFEGQDRP